MGEQANLLVCAEIYACGSVNDTCVVLRGLDAAVRLVGSHTYAEVAALRQQWLRPVVRSFSFQLVDDFHQIDASTKPIPTHPLLSLFHQSLVTLRLISSALLINNYISDQSWSTIK
jgi:hypothetical protein